MSESNVAYSSIIEPEFVYPTTSVNNPNDNSNNNDHSNDIITATMKNTSTRSSIFHAIHLGVAFCLVFLAFSVAQNSQTSDLGTPGNISLGILYGVFTLCNLFSSWLINVIGINLSLVIGALTYAAYVACNIYIIDAVLYISSGIIGFGAAIIWTAQGAYISYCATAHEAKLGLPTSSTVGLFNGIFFSIFQVNQFAGNLLAALLYQFDVSKEVVFIVMTSICAFGAGVLALLHRPVSLKVKEEERSPILSAAGTESHLNVYSDEHVVTACRTERPSLSKILASLSLFSDPRMLFTICIIIYSGLSQAYIYGVFTSLVPGTEKSWKFYAMSCFGGVDALTSVTLGKLSDKVGRVPIIIVGFIAHGAAYVYFMFFYHSGVENPHYLYFILAFALGVGDAVFNTQVYAILATFFEHKAEQAFANYKLFQSGSTTVAFVYSIYYPSAYLFFQTLVPGVFLVLGCASLFICHIFYCPLNTNDNKTQGESIERLASSYIAEGDFPNDDLDETRPQLAIPRRRVE